MEKRESNFEGVIKRHDIAFSIIVGSIIIASTMIYIAKPISFDNNESNQASGSVAEPTLVKVKDRKDAPTIGDINAKVTLVEFSDFQCPFCQQFYNTAYKEIKKNYVDKGLVKIVFRHYPLSFHKNAQISAEAAECANLQGRFADYHDKLFTVAKSDGTNLDEFNLKKYAKDLGLDTQKFNSCLDNGDTTDKVKADFADGQSAGVNGTPTIFVNGRAIVGALPYADFDSAIKEALK